jgi:SAM-dependent methyltransferase
MEIQEPFKPFVDHTGKDEVKHLTTQPVNITEGVAIDWQNPYDPDVAAWRLACSFYPQELQALPDVIALENRLAQSNHVRFLEGNLLALPVGTPDLPLHGFDAVVMNTVCYQMPQAQEHLVQTAQKLLKPQGFFIIQDFAQKDPANPTLLNFSVNWHQQPFSYRTFIVGPSTNGEMKELLQWEDGRCKAVRPGEDFSLLQDAA